MKNKENDKDVECDRSPDDEHCWHIVPIGKVKPELPKKYEKYSEVFVCCHCGLIEGGTILRRLLNKTHGEYVDV